MSSGSVESSGTQTSHGPPPTAAATVRGMEVSQPADDREVLFERTFAAPRALVWQAWTAPELLGRWWGPHGFTCPVCRVELEAGGALRLDMRGPDGTDYPTVGTVLEVVAPSRLVFTLDTSEHPPEWQREWHRHRGTPQGGPSLLVRVTATFEEAGGSTRVSIRSRLASAADRAAYVSMGSPVGWAMSLEKLDGLLAADREVVTERVLDAPRDLVFRAFTERDQVVHWWGPFGSTNLTTEFDPRPGGSWRFTMRAADGTELPNLVEYVELVRPERLVYRHGGAVPGARAVLTWVTFTEEGGRTRVTMRARFESAAARQEAEALGIVEVGRQTFDRLAAQVALRRHAPGPSGPPFTVARVLTAPRALVWEAWTAPDRLAAWWGPAGLKLTVKTLELRPGGTFLYGMTAPDGQASWGKFTYLEVEAPHRLLFVVSFCDEAGTPRRHPMAPTWPLETLSVLSLAERDGQTTLVLAGLPLHATAEERATFQEGFESMRGGWAGTLDKLEAHLAGG